MELKSNQPKKKTIDCLSIDSISIHEDLWYIEQLRLDGNEEFSFDQESCANIKEYKEILNWCVSIMDHSPSARLMLKEACDKDWRVTMEDLCGSDYWVDVDDKLIIIDSHGLEPEALAHSNYFRNVALVTFVKALRDVWQEKRYGGFDEHYSPEHVLLMERIRAADLDVVAVLAAWELRSEEFSDMWRHMIGSEIGDMAMIYSGHLERDPSAQFNGHGLVACFKQWFRDAKRLDACDHDTLEYLDDVLAISEEANPFGDKKPSRMNIEILSCLPDKTAYLQGMGGEILGNPVYASVDNIINQAHLFHIKHDLEAVIVENVAFRDADLARLIFPVEEE